MDENMRTTDNEDFFNGSAICFQQTKESLTSQTNTKEKIQSGSVLYIGAGVQVLIPAVTALVRTATHML